MADNTQEIAAQIANPTHWDWLTFIASVIDSIAWPLVVGLVIFLLRKELPDLLKRLKGATVGNTKVEFDQALDNLRQESELVTREILPQENLAPDDPSLTLAKQFPEAAVLEAYKTVEAILIELRSHLDLSPKSNLRKVVQRLVERELVEPGTRSFFESFQMARNASAHANEENRVTPGEALEYMKQAKILSDIFRNALNKIPF